MRGCNDGSIHTSEQTSVITLAVKSLNSLCLTVGRPPVGQQRTWSTKKTLPHMHLLGRRVGCQLYLRHKASRKAPLCRAKPCSCMGRAESHVEAPFSLPSSMARCKWRGSCAFNSVAALDRHCHLVFLTVAFASCWSSKVSAVRLGCWSRMRAARGAVTFVEEVTHGCTSWLDR